MALTHVKQIIDQALADQSFYEALMTRPDEILKAYTLNESEKMMIRNLAKSPYTQAKKGLLDTERLVVAAIEYAPPSNDA